MTIEECREAARKFSYAKVELEKEVVSLNPVQIVTPVNLKEQKEKWLDQANYGCFTNPEFVYDDCLLSDVIEKRHAIYHLRRKIRRIIPRNRAEDFYIHHLEHVVEDASLTINIAQAIKSHDDRALASTVIEKYGKPEGKVIEFAKALAETGFLMDNQPKALSGIDFSQRELDLLEKAKFNSDAIRETLVWAMEQYAKFSPLAKPWPVEVGGESLPSKIKDEEYMLRPIITVPSNCSVNGLELAKLVGQKIDVFWHTTQNEQLLSLFRADSESLYEGYKEMKEFKFDEFFNYSLSYPSPFFVLAADLAMQGESFKDVAEYLRSKAKLDLEETWYVTYHAFRGISDTSNRVQYAFTRDKKYLEGYLSAQEMRQEGEEAYLSFSFLSKDDLGEIKLLLDKEEIRKNAISDLDIQEVALKKLAS